MTLVSHQRRSTLHYASLGGRPGLGSYTLSGAGRRLVRALSRSSYCASEWEQSSRGDAVCCVSTFRFLMCLDLGVRLDFCNALDFVMRLKFCDALGFVNV